MKYKGQMKETDGSKTFPLLTKLVLSHLASMKDHNEHRPHHRKPHCRQTAVPFLEVPCIVAEAKKQFFKYAFVYCHCEYSLSMKVYKRTIYVCIQIHTETQPFHIIIMTTILLFCYLHYLT